MLNSRTLRRTLAVAGSAAVAAFAVSDASAAQRDQDRGRDRDRAVDDSRLFYGVTGSNVLLSFTERRPNRILDADGILGLVSGERIVGIDFRPRTGDLYAVSDRSIVYRVNPDTKIAIAENRDAMGMPVPFTPALRGTKFNVDFNPVPDAIRVTSNQAQNLRLSPDGGNVLGVDMDLNPGTPNIVGSAYTNSSFSATPPAATTLYGVDATQDQLFIQNPPNNGTLTNPVRLDVNVGDDTAFDIVGTADNAKGYIITRGPRARGSSLYRVNLTSGRTKNLGPVGNGRTTIVAGAAYQDLP
jgi:Domain of unknown function (DUF4394)